MPRVTSYRVNAVRDVVRKRVEATSLREIADEIGMSFSGLRTFLGGTRPQPATWQKLEKYIAATGTSAFRRQLETIPRAEVEAALELLERYISAEGRESLQSRRVREVTKRLFDKEYPPE